MNQPRDRLTASRLDLLLDAICDEFEQDLKDGRPGNLGTRISGYRHSNKAELFRELILLQLAYTAADKRQEQIEQFMVQFPEYLEILVDVLRPNVTQVTLRETSEAPPPLEASVSHSASPAALPVRQIAHYRLLRSLGEGGFGTVYLAHDEKLGRIVAVKIPHGHEDGEERERFFREARNAARLDHPGIVRLYESGEFGGVPYLAMEYVAGAPLSSDTPLETRGKKAECRRVVRLVLDIAQALSHAHTRGIVHRDLKPSNILIDSAGNPHISDFGLAKRNFGDVTLTSDGKLLGTLAYMAPEQARQGAHYVDGRADLYSLGVILFELLTGHVPFTGTPGAVLNQLLHDDPAPPSRLVPGIRLELDTIVLKCLEKSPGRRYGSADLLATDLRLWLEGAPIHARPVGTVGRLAKFVKRHPWPSLLGGGLVLALMSTASLGTVNYMQAQTARHSLALSCVSALQHADVSAVPDVLRLLAPMQQEVSTDIRDLLDQEALSDGERVRLLLACQQLRPTDQTQLLRASLRASFSELGLYRMALLRHGTVDTALLWQVLSDRSESELAQLKAVHLLSSIDPAGQQWEALGQQVASLIVDADSIELSQWLASMSACPQPVLAALRQEMQAIPASDKAALVLMELYRESPQEQASLLLSASELQALALLSWLKDNLATLPAAQATELRGKLNSLAPLGIHAQSTQLLALSLLGDDQPLMSSLLVTRDCTLRTEVMVKLEGLLTADQLGQKLAAAAHADQHQAILLALGRRLRRDPLATQNVRSVVETLLVSDDSGVHAAAEWTIEALQGRTTPATSVASAAPAGAKWYWAKGGPKMILISPRSEAQGSPSPRDRGRAFYLASSEITVGQFASYNAELAVRRTATADQPVTDLDFQEVARYCNWLSHAEGLPESEWCYRRQEAAGEESPLVLVTDFLTKSGFRLPTTSEWDLACHGDSTTRQHFGDQLERINRFGWSLQNSGGKVQPVRQLWPDRQGLFDMLGNATEMCHPTGGAPGANCGYMGGSAIAVEEGLGLRAAFETLQTTFVMGGFRVARSVVP